MDDKLNQLIDRARNLDRNAFGEIYELYVDGIYRYVFYRLFDKKDAEDVTEEVFIKAMNGIAGYQADKGSFTGWLYGIARNTVIDYFRLVRRETAVVEAAAARRTEKAGDETDAFVVEMIRQALGDLTEEQREVIVLRFYAGLKISEIAEHMDKPESAIKALQRRASLKLAKSLGGEW
ncbi:MAG: sigma-70 family RNA polymerase sigma factor [Actinomycetota bacterium]